MKIQKKFVPDIQNFSPLEQRRIFLDTPSSVIPHNTNTEYSVDMYSKSMQCMESDAVKKEAIKNFATLKYNVNTSLAYKVKNAKTLHEAFEYIDGVKSANNFESRKIIFMQNADEIAKYAQIQTDKYSGSAAQNNAFKAWIQHVLLEQESQDYQFSHAVEERGNVNPDPLSVKLQNAFKGKEFSGNAEKFVNAARQFALDKKPNGKSRIPYKWGGTDLRTGVDCSGFTQSLLQQQGINIPRVAQNQAKYGKNVSPENFFGGDFSGLKSGDLLFFNKGGNSRVSHVAIYSGNGHMIDARSTKIGIVETPITPYYKGRFVTARRYIA